MPNKIREIYSVNGSKCWKTCNGPSIYRRRCPMPLILVFNTLRPKHNGRHFADDIFKCIFLNENVWIPIKISVKFVPKGPINYIPALVQIMAWCRPGDKPWSETMMVRLLTHICVTRPQWVDGCLCLVSHLKCLLCAFIYPYAWNASLDERRCICVNCVLCFMADYGTLKLVPFAALCSI